MSKENQSSNSSPLFLIIACLTSIGLFGLGYYLGSQANPQGAMQKMDSTDDVERLQEKLGQQQTYVQAAEICSDVIQTLAVGDSSVGAGMTLEEARDLVDRLNQLGDADAVIQSQFTAPLNAVVAEFDKDIPQPGEKFSSWRGMAKYWETRSQGPAGQ